MKCSKCGGKVAERVPGTLSCVCSDHQIGSFAPRPETWSRPTTHAADWRTVPAPNKEPDIQELIDDQIYDYLANR